MNTYSAWGLTILLLVYFTVELGWGGSLGDWRSYQRPNDVARHRRRPPRDWSWFEPKGPCPRRPDEVKRHGKIKDAVL